MKFWLNSHDAVLINLPGKLVCCLFALKRLMAKNRPIIARSHNAEFFHHLEMASTHRKVANKFHAFVYAISCLFSDIWTARICDYIFVISQFDLENYWASLQKMQFTSYQPIDFFSSTDKRDVSKSTVRVVSVGSAKKGGHIALDQEPTFYKHARDFVMPPQFQFYQIVLNKLAPSNVVALPFVEDFVDLRRQQRDIGMWQAGWGENQNIRCNIFRLIVVLEAAMYFRVDKSYRYGCFAFGPNAEYANFESASRRVVKICQS